jgi:hypothetical protein
MEQSMHPVAIEHLPPFVTAPGQTDILFIVVVIFILAMILIIGNLYFRLHALPEHMMHGTSKVQMEFVAVLTLLALFTHNHLFWIAALLLAFIDLPDFSTPISSMARSLEKLAGRGDARQDKPPTGRMLASTSGTHESTGTRESTGAREKEELTDA